MLDARAGLGVAVDPLLEQAQLERKRHEALLRAVVQVALEPLTLLLAGLDDPQARAPELLHARGQLGLQPCVLQREAGRRADGGEQLGLVVHRRVVNQRGDRRAVALDERGPWSRPARAAS